MALDGLLQILAGAQPDPDRGNLDGAVADEFTHARAGGDGPEPLAEAAHNGAVLSRCPVSTAGGKGTMAGMPNSRTFMVLTPF